MSIQDRIIELERANELFLLEPLIGHGGLCRCVYVSKDLIQLVHEDAQLPNRLANVGMKARSVFDSFTIGKRMTFGMDPHEKKKHCEIARTGPVALGIISIRIRDPKPQLRIFGAMATKDVFVGLVWKERNLIANSFGPNVRSSKTEWDRLFPKHSPVVSETPDDYLSNHFLV